LFSGFSCGVAYCIRQPSYIQFYRGLFQHITNYCRKCQSLPWNVPFFDTENLGYRSPGPHSAYLTSECIFSL